MGFISAIVAKVIRQGKEPSLQPDALDGDFVRNKVVEVLTKTPEVPATRHQQIIESVLLNPQDRHAIAILIEDLVPTKKRRGVIVHNLSQAAIVFSNIRRQLDLGIEKAVWRYSGAPCSPPLDEIHRGLDGKIYPVREGLLIDGRCMWPGSEEGCKCSSTSIIPGLEGD